MQHAKQLDGYILCYGYFSSMTVQAAAAVQTSALETMQANSTACYDITRYETAMTSRKYYDYARPA